MARSLRTISLAAALVLVALPAIADAQPQQETAENRVGLDLGWPVVGPSYVRAIAGDWSVGGFAGINMLVLGNVEGDPTEERLGPMIVTGSHVGYPFAEAESLRELLRGEIFASYSPHRRWSFDFGVRCSAFIHSISGEGQAAIFLAGFGGVLYGTERFSIGPRIAVGHYNEGMYAQVLAFHIMPVHVRIAFGF